MPMGSGAVRMFRAEADGRERREGGSDRRLRKSYESVVDTIVR